MKSKPTLSNRSNFLFFRMKICAVEKAALQERVKRLENENASLISQLRNVQSTMAGFAGKATPMSTAFLIMVMSVALLLAPSVRDSSKLEFEEVVGEEEAGSDARPSFGGVEYGATKFGQFGDHKYIK